MRRLTLITLLTLTLDICFAQSIDVSKERYKGVSTLTIKTLNGCCAKKGFRAKYYFNDNGEAIESKHFFRLEKRAQYSYIYDSHGNLTHKIITFDINNKNRSDTSLTRIEYDSDNRIVKASEYHRNELLWVRSYSQFNEFDEPEIHLAHSTWNSKTTKFVLSYNEDGKVCKSQKLEGDSLATLHIIGYNEHGDKNYSLIPSVVGKENEPLAIWIGGGRHAPEEQYEYTYDIENRWIEKYVIYEDKKVLLETRKYK